LLSSWQDRVACRYGLTAMDLAHWLEPDTDAPQGGGFETRDFAPDEAALRSWARGCRLSSTRLAELALIQRARALEWYVIDPGCRGVCAGCLDEDRLDGHDHCRRRSWAHVEALACPRHKCLLFDYCGRCFSRAGLRYHGGDGPARLICASCSAPVCARRQEGADGEGVDFLLAMAAEISGAVASAGSSLREIARAALLLWSPAERNGKPFIAWLDGSLTAGSIGRPSEPAAPLATASVRWRAAMLTGVAQLLDLAGARQRFGPPPGYLVQAFASGRGGESGASARANSKAQRPRMTLGLRPQAHYRAMAERILASPEWRKLEGAGEAARNRQIGRLMIAALDRAPQDRAAGLAR
jgi:hypothetical protein